MPRVVLGVTGCIGAYKACEVLRELQKRDVDVHVVMTDSATRFVAPLTFEALSHHPVFVDQMALGEQGEIRHISLADAADLAALRARGVGIVEPGAGYLACGWLGKGRLAEVPEIVAAALAVLSR